MWHLLLFSSVLNEVENKLLLLLNERRIRSDDCRARARWSGATSSGARARILTRRERGSKAEKRARADEKENRLAAREHERASERADNERRSARASLKIEQTSARKNRRLARPFATNNERVL